MFFNFDVLFANILLVVRVYCHLVWLDFLRPKPDSNDAKDANVVAIPDSKH